QVRGPVWVQVRADIGVDGGAEATRTVAEQHTDFYPLVLNPVDRSERGHVETAVVVEIRRDNVLRTRAQRVVHGGREAQQPASFEHVAARAADCLRPTR